MRSPAPITLVPSYSLRYLQTLAELGGEHNSTVVVLTPLDTVKPFLDILNKYAVPPPTNGTTVPTLLKLKEEVLK